MQRAIQSLARTALLAGCCLAGCSRDQPPHSNVSSSPVSPQTSDASAVELKQGFDQTTKERSLQDGNRPLRVPPAHVATLAASRNELSSPTNLPRTADACVAEAKEADNLLEYETALRLCDEALRISPDNPEALIQRGLAWAHIAEETAFNERFVPERQRIEWENALRDFTHAANVAPEGSSLAAAAAYYCSAATMIEHAYSQQQLQEVVKLCDAVLAQDPEDIEVLLCRGELKLRMRITDPEGLADMVRAVELDPERLTSQRRLSAVYHGLGDTKNVAKIADEMLRRFPDSPWGFTTQFAAFSRLGKYDQALEAAIRANSVSKSKSVKWVRCDALRNAGENEDAIACLLELQKAEPESVKIYHYLAETYAASGNFLAAHKMAKEFQHRVSNANIASRQLAVMIEQGIATSQRKKWSIGGPYNRWSDPTPADAMKNVAHRLQTEPPNARLFIDCGIEYYRVEDFEEALSCFSRAIDLEPQNAEAHGRRGVTFNHLQQKAKAGEDFLKACRLDVDTHSRR